MKGKRSLLGVGVGRFLAVKPVKPQLLYFVLVSVLPLWPGWNGTARLVSEKNFDRNESFSFTLQTSLPPSFLFLLLLLMYYASRTNSVISD